MAKKKFPQDCPHDCQHFHAWDMSVDDWTCVCDLLKVQIDECDTDFQFMYCPLPDNDDKNGALSRTVRRHPAF